MPLKIGIDLGGTKTEIVVLDGRQQPIYRQRVATPAADYDAIVELIADLIDAAEATCGETGSVGIGVPGAISPASGVLRNSNTICLNGRALLRDIEVRLEREIRIENDANCFAWSEALHGAARDYDVVFGVIVGTGTGGGLVVNGQLLNGPHAISGEWGHNPLPWRRSTDGAPRCYCGRTGCIETYLSGPGLAANYRARFGISRSSRQIVSAAQAGDDSCCEMMVAYYDQMARALAHVINILDPQVVVVGGGMSTIESIYTEVPPRLPAYVFSDFVDTPLLPAELGDASGVYGAALLWE